MVAERVQVGDFVTDSMTGESGIVTRLGEETYPGGPLWISYRRESDGAGVSLSERRLSPEREFTEPPPKPGGLPFVCDDGGREAAGFTGKTGDCVTRAIAIATGKPYREVYDALHEGALEDRALMAAMTLRYGKNARRHASPRDGVARKVYDRYLKSLGWEWTPTMHVGSGCTVHLTPGELPGGNLVVRVSKHVCAVIDGELHDTGDCSREGTRCVYGFWQAP